MSTNDDQSATPPWTIVGTLRWTADYFKQRGIESPRPDAEILLAHTLRCERIDLYLHHDQPLNADELHRFKQSIQRRVRREPVAYITGRKEFWSLDFKVTPEVLIPRPETEGLVEAALQHYTEHDAVHVLELGTGSGIISISLAHERPQWQFLALDISPQAVDLARLNARKLLSEERISFMVGNWFDAIDAQGACFNLIVSNPPYIASKDMVMLAPEILQHEPSRALDGGSQGLASIAHIIQMASGYLKPDGKLLLEIGYDQGAAVKTLGDACGAYDQVIINKDYSGHERIACLRKAS